MMYLNMNLHRRGMRRLVPVAIVALFIAGGVACSNDDATDSTTPTAADVATETDMTSDDSTTTAASGEADVIDVTAADFAFAGIPDTVPAGSRFSLTTAAGAEPHEMVVMKVPDGETRSIEDLVALPMEELEAIFAGDPVMVLISMPGTTDTPGVVFPEGAQPTVTEPGRYIVICSFPEGTTPEDIENAQGPLEGPGTPHFVLGMTGEFTVE